MVLRSNILCIWDGMVYWKEVRSRLGLDKKAKCHLCARRHGRHVYVGAWYTESIAPLMFEGTSAYVHLAMLFRLSLNP